MIVIFVLFDVYRYFQRANEGERIEFVSSLSKMDKQVTVQWYR